MTPPIVIIGLVGLVCWLAHLRHQHVEQRRLEERRLLAVMLAPEIEHVVVHPPGSPPPPFYDWQHDREAGLRLEIEESAAAA